MTSDSQDELDQGKPSVKKNSKKLVFFHWLALSYCSLSQG